MRKTLILFPMLFLILTSCNFPLAKSTDTAGLVATKVAETLTATYAVTQPDVTVVVVTLTPEATATETITPTATPADPKTTLGTPVYADTFTSGSAFGLKTPYSDDAVEMSVENGNLVMSTTRTYSGYRWRLTYLTPKNYYVEGTFNTVTCSGADSYGLVMRSPNYTDGIGYYFGITCGGEYYFLRSNAVDYFTLADWTSDDAILKGTDQENRLGVMLQDDHFSLYINGKLVKELDDGNINAAGYFGVFINSIEQTHMEIDVEEINQWNLP